MKIIIEIDNQTSLNEAMELANDLDIFARNHKNKWCIREVTVQP